jgi:membrane associated rhomboid family serine protease
MGLYDRDYVREEPRGIHLGSEWSGVALAIAINVVVYVIDLISNGKISNLARLNGDLFHNPLRFWQLFTYGWLHDLNAVQHIAFNMISLWFFGSTVENTLGKKRFWQFYCSSIILAGLCWVIAQQPWFPQLSVALPAAQRVLVGASGGIMALIILAVWLFPSRLMMLFGLIPMPAWLFGTIMVLMDLNQIDLSSSKSNIAFSAHIGGALVGTLYHFTHWCLFDLWPQWLWPDRLFSKAARRGFKVHRPDDDEPEQRNSGEAQMIARMDEILKKMSAVGHDNLTQAERDFLANASRKLRDRKKR